MIHTIAAIKDRAADAYLRPIFTNTAGQAIRIFQDEVNRNAEDNIMYKHPEDFDLYLLGEYDDSTGLLTAKERPEQIAIGKNAKINP